MVAGAVALAAGGCGSTPDEPRRDPLDVAPPTDADLAESARGTSPGPSADPNSSSRVLAYVNGEVINYRDVFLRIGPQLAVVADETSKAELERRELITLLRDRLLHQAAVEAGIDVTRDELDKERARRIRDLERSGATLDAFLSERGMTRRELDDTLRRDLRAQRYLRAAVGLGGEGAAFVRARTDTFVTPADTRRHYDRNLERYHEPATARVRVLPVRADLRAEDREAAVADARRRAEGYLARLRGGEDFVPVFREATADEPDPADGLVEIRERGKAAAWIEEFAFEQPRGTLSDPIQKGPTYYILRAEGVSPERQRPYVEVQSEIEDLLAQRRRAVASYEVELALVEDAVIRPAELSKALREELSAARRRIVADAGL